jgi:hypothetical protein
MAYGLKEFVIIAQGPRTIHSGVYVGLSEDSAMRAFLKAHPEHRIVSISETVKFTGNANSVVSDVVLPGYNN